jgi:hypothetical protein
VQEGIVMTVRSLAVARRAVARAATAAAVLLAVLAVSGVAAVADEEIDPPAPPTSGAASVDVGKCRLYANARNFGVNCFGPRFGKTTTIKDLLGGDPFAECRYEPLPDDMSVPATHAGEAGAWYLKTCLKGIGEDGAGRFERTSELEWFPPEKPVPTLTTRQEQAWEARAHQSAYPMPLPQFGPAARPRVLIPTYFWLTESTSAPIRHTAFDGDQYVLMEAYVAGIDVTPGTDDALKPTYCPAPLLPYDRSRAIGDQPSGCSYTYHRSSASRPGQTYSVTVQARWAVRYKPEGGVWTEIGEFALANVFDTPVDEIQTVGQ